VNAYLMELEVSSGFRLVRVAPALNIQPPLKVVRHTLEG